MLSLVDKHLPISLTLLVTHCFQPILLCFGDRSAFDAFQALDDDGNSV